MASKVDPLYAKTLAEAIAVGVEVIAWRADLSAHEIVLSQAIPCLQDLPVPERAD